MDITWVRELPLWIKAAVVLLLVLALLAVVAWRKSKNPASRGIERKLRGSDDE
jgi:hypothetical protein